MRVKGHTVKVDGMTTRLRLPPGFPLEMEVRRTVLAYRRGVSVYDSSGKEVLYVTEKGLFQWADEEEQTTTTTP